MCRSRRWPCRPEDRPAGILSLAHGKKWLVLFPKHPERLQYWRTSGRLLDLRDLARNAEKLRPLWCYGERPVPMFEYYRPIAGDFSMSRTILSMSLAAAATWTLVLLTAPTAVAQGPFVPYYSSPPVVTYVPEVRGLFGQRLVYRPVVSVPGPYLRAAVSPWAVIPAPAVPVSTYYAPAPAPVLGYAAPVTTYYAPAAPVVSYPAPVTAYYAPAVPVVGYPARVTTYYAPVRVVAPRVITSYPPWMVP